MLKINVNVFSAGNDDGNMIVILIKIAMLVMKNVMIIAIVIINMIITIVIIIRKMIIVMMAVIKK